MLALQSQYTPPVTVLKVGIKLSASPPSEEMTSLERVGERSDGEKKLKKETEAINRKDTREMRNSKRSLKPGSGGMGGAFLLSDHVKSMWLCVK